MIRLAIFFNIATVAAFVNSPRPGRHCFALNGANKNEDIIQQNAFGKGTLVEFAEKGRVHVGKIASAEHKSNGNARYDVVDDTGKHYGIPDKAVNFAMPAPNNDPAAEKLFNDFISAHKASENDLKTKLDISPELLEMAWEEAAEDESHELTPKSLIDLIHSRAASAIEAYMAWRLLKTDMAHVFFREMKKNGRVVSFKAKARKSVDAAKQAFCSKQENQDNDLCFV